MQILAINIFISFLQNPPSDFLLKKMKEEGFWREFLQVNKPLQAKALKILTNLNENENFIASDYTSLFLSDTDFVKAPLYASFYLSKDKEIYSLNSQKVREIFIKHNFLEFFDKEPADSMINELLFIRYLIKSKDFESLARFLKEDFSWFFEWNLDVLNNAKSEFYKALAMIMKDFFEELIINLK